MGRFEGGGLSGEIFLWTSARVPNSAPRPHPHRAALTHFPGLVPSPKFALGSTQAEAQPQPPPPHHKHTHGHSSLPLLPSLGYPRNRPISGKVIRFKGPGLEMEAEARGNRGDGRAAKGFSRTAPQPPTNTPVCSCKRGLPAHPVTKGGGKQIPRGEEASVRPLFPGTRRALCSPQRGGTPHASPSPGLGVGWGRGLGAPDLDAGFPVWGVATPRLARRTCPGVPRLFRKLFYATAMHPGLVVASTHPVATPPWVSAQMLELRAEPAHLGPRGGAMGTLAQRSLGNSSRFLQASSRNLRCGKAERPGIGRARLESEGPRVGQITPLPQNCSHSKRNLGRLGVEGSGKEGLGWGWGLCLLLLGASGCAARRPCCFGGSLAAAFLSGASNAWS